MENKYFSTKRFGPISTGHRQWRAENHCAFIHGYGRIVEITFGCKELDDKGWVVDFGGLRHVKEFLERNWDHKVLIASDDPHLDKIEAMQKLGLVQVTTMYPPYGPGIELSAKWVLDKVNVIVYGESQGRCWVEKVQIWEHENNSAICRR